MFILSESEIEQLMYNESFFGNIKTFYLNFSSNRNKLRYVKSHINSLSDNFKKKVDLPAASPAKVKNILDSIMPIIQNRVKNTTGFFDTGNKNITYTGINNLLKSDILEKKEKIILDKDYLKRSNFFSECEKLFNVIDEFENIYKRDTKKNIPFMNRWWMSALAGVAASIKIDQLERIRDKAFSKEEKLNINKFSRLVFTQYPKVIMDIINSIMEDIRNNEDK